MTLADILKRTQWSEVDIVTQCLWDMTYEGYGPSQVTAAADQLESLWEEHKQRLESEQDDEPKTGNR